MLNLPADYTADDSAIIKAFGNVGQKMQALDVEANEAPISRAPYQLQSCGWLTKVQLTKLNIQMAHDERRELSTKAVY